MRIDRSQIITAGCEKFKTTGQLKSLLSFLSAHWPLIGLQFIGHVRARTL